MPFFSKLSGHCQTHRSPLLPPYVCSSAPHRESTGSLRQSQWTWFRLVPHPGQSPSHPCRHNGWMGLASRIACLTASCKSRVCRSLMRNDAGSSETSTAAPVSTSVTEKNSSSTVKSKRSRNDSTQRLHSSRSEERRVGK